MITLTNCTSKLMQAHGYQASTQTLAVRFGPGRIYHYKDVPQAVYDEFAAAESIGVAFAKLVRGKFEHEVVLDESESLETTE